MLHFHVQNARLANLNGAPSATVADAIRLALPAGAHILQGHQRLNRSISWVRSFISRPWAIGNIDEGTLVILSLRGLAGRELLGLPRLFEALSAAAVSAVVLSDDLPS